MASGFTCCGLWLFGRHNNSYSRIIDNVEDFECPDRWRAEIDLGLPPGVQIGDLLRNNQSMNTLRQVYLLAVQSNSITDHLNRFDAVSVPESCKGVVNAQITKLQAVRSVIWNMMISLAVSGLAVEEEGFKALLDKQAGDSLALMEMEKMATALKTDDTGAWAQELSTFLASMAQPVIHVNPPDFMGQPSLPTAITNQPERVEPRVSPPEGGITCIPASQ
ncbi:ORF49 [callitrichine gammaherpesvirus 3]|uniref:ORF49 n=1 Tax=callitrichine gammaherpesvirus 3 TaxID=106331 RepID=Q993G0_9GAMA|nr:ORF49 [callitrichine gammaherpesvirus 3]AAK38258.1 ORF49 [callitrichine gammaherpesvirus 3]